MKKYEAYKNSGVEWIGEIPEGWGLSKLKFETSCLDGRRVPVEKSSRKDGPYPYWGAGSITCYVDSYLFDEELVLLGEDGAPFFDPNRPVAFYVNEKIWANNHIHVLKAGSRVMAKYMTYMLNIVDYNAFINGSVLTKLTQSNMDEIPFLLPSLSEQQAIASYLDHKVGQIDASVSAINTQIDDLKAYRQSIISEAVTKGLNPNVPMKDSGIEWIGEIPEGWNITKLGWAYPNMGSGTTPDSNNLQYYIEDGYNWLQTGDLTDGAITSTSKHLSQIAVDEKRMRFYPIGSIVIAMYGATIGKVGYLEIETSTNQACCVLPPQESMDNRFMFYLMQSSKATLISKSVGGGQPNISQAIIQEHRIPVPSVSEQQAIASYLDSQTSKIDATIASLESQRDDLNALKQSVISEAVTGKIDVREWYKDRTE